MKRKDITSLHSKTQPELEKMLLDLRVSLTKKRQEKRVGKLADTRSVSRTSDDIARILSVLAQKNAEMSEEKEA
jgi:ribosomal protein L29